MYNGMSVYRGVITYTDGSQIYARIPALAGNETALQISTNVINPRVSIGDQVVVAVEDDKAYNIHVVSSSPAVIAQDGGSA